MHRTGRVDADELNHHPPPAPQAHLPVFQTRLTHNLHLLLEPTVAEVKVDEAGLGGHNALHFVYGNYAPDQLLRQFQGVDARGAG